MALLAMPRNPLGFSVAMETWDTLPTRVVFSRSPKVGLPFLRTWELLLYTHNGTGVFFRMESLCSKKKFKALDPESQEVKLSLFTLNPAVCLSVFSVPWNRDEQGWHSQSGKKRFFFKINLRGIAVRGRKYFRDLLRDSVYLPAQSRAEALWLQHSEKRLKMVGKEKKNEERLRCWDFTYG